MLKRTSAEIKARYEEVSQRFLDFQGNDLLPYMDYEDAKPFLKEGVTAEQLTEAREVSAARSRKPSTTCRSHGRKPTTVAACRLAGPSITSRRGSGSPVTTSMTTSMSATNTTASPAW
jgi:hypothetical protein